MRSSGRSWSARDALLRAQRRSPPALVRFVLAVAQQLQRLEPFDRAMTLAAQAFTSIFPVVIVAFSVLPAPDSDRLGSRVAKAFELPEETRATLADAFPQDTGTATTFGGLSLLIVLLSATSFSRALTRMYAKAWSVRGPGWHSPWRWIAAILVVAACTVGLQATQHAAAGSVPGMVGVLLLAFAVNTVLWTWVPSLLLAHEVPWRLLAPGGLLMGLASVPLLLAGRVYMPSALSYADRQFGELGIAFTCIGWLFSVAFVLVVATVLGAAVAREPGPASRYLSRWPIRPAEQAEDGDEPA